jgi:hypothetical protein
LMERLVSNQVDGKNYQLGDQGLWRLISSNT